MISVASNKSLWTHYDWSRAGDEWSGPFGTAVAQWNGSIFPRTFPWLRGNILEIATGYGRWTQFLLGYCDKFLGVDLSEPCIEHCRGIFASHSNAKFEVTDGRTLSAAEPTSIDFAFSFDSLVHAESDVLNAYVRELARVLKPNAIAFIHHSNLNAVPRRYLDLLRGRKETRSLRAPTMSAAKMRHFVKQARMSCLHQELIPWAGKRWPPLIDCMTTIINCPDIEPLVLKNRRFLEEAEQIKLISS